MNDLAPINPISSLAQRYAQGVKPRFIGGDIETTAKKNAKVLTLEILFSAYRHWNCATHIDEMNTAEAEYLARMEAKGTPDQPIYTEVEPECADKDLEDARRLVAKVFLSENGNPDLAYESMMRFIVSNCPHFGEGETDGIKEIFEEEGRTIDVTSRVSSSSVLLTFFNGLT